MAIDPPRDEFLLADELIDVGCLVRSNACRRSLPKLLLGPLPNAPKCTISVVENLSTQVFHSNFQKAPCKTVPLGSATEKD